MPQTSRDWIFAISLSVLACFLLAGMDNLGKILMREGLPAMQVVWARYSFHTLLVLLVLLPQRDVLFKRSAHPWIQFFRGLSLLAMTLCAYNAFKHAPIGEATAIMLLAPLIVTLLAGWLLKEKVLWWHWLAALLGFSGVIAITQPGIENTNPYLYLALVAAFFYAFYLLMTRYLRGRDHNLKTLLNATLIGSVLMSLVVLPYWHTPTIEQWLILISLGVLGALGHFCIIKAYNFGDASSLSPLLNTQIFAAALFSSFIFDDALTTGFMIGTLLIISGAIMLWLGHQKRLVANK